MILNRLQALLVLLKLVQAFIKEAEWSDTTPKALLSSFNSYCNSIVVKDIENWNKQI